MIEGRQSANHPNHDRHRVGITPKAAKKAAQLLIQHRVISDIQIELPFFCRVWQLTVEQQITHFQELTMIRQISNCVTAMQQNSLFAIDKGNPRVTTAGGNKTRVVGEVP